MKKTAIVYGSTTGNTEKAAMLIAEEIGKDNITMFNVVRVTVKDLVDFEVLILGTSTWGYGDLQDDWDSFLPSLKNSDLNGKILALFGLGDSSSFDETYADGIGIIYEALKSTGAVFVGKCDPAGYSFRTSKAVIDGMFAGLPLDEDNESDKTPGRITAWVESIRKFIE